MGALASTLMLGLTLTAGSIQKGELYTAWLYVGAVEKLWEQLHPTLRARFHDQVEELRRERRRLIGGLGMEKHLEAERIEAGADGNWYVREARFQNAPNAMRLKIAIDSAGFIHQFLVEPVVTEPAPTRFLEYQDHTPLRLPVDGIWHVQWGGRSQQQNRHAGESDQRFAYDFDQLVDGRDHTGDGRVNADYRCFGQPVVAPAAGTVMRAVDGIADNEPGRAAVSPALGNYVILDHGEGEQSVLAQLQQGSVMVKPGAKVARGALLGRCGNSGRSSLPHVHYHLQNDAVPPEGLPAQFGSFMADGLDVARGEPVRGQFISHFAKEEDKNDAKAR